ncbi:hypothetical protein [Kosmotoga pacifica]|nr:hypothetical protein [Kosmotoga pacifica]
MSVRSLSIIGLEKNTGKTESMKYIIRRIKETDPQRVLCLTSIGLDGEAVDQVTFTPKPEVIIHEGDLFATSEVHYREKNFLSEVLWVSAYRTALGRVVLSRALEKGKVKLSGPSTLSGLKELMKVAKKQGTDLFLLDGALSRRSSASPFLCEGVVLATGAALSLNFKEIIRKTLHHVRLMNLPIDPMANHIEKFDEGIWLIKKGVFEKLPYRTLLGDTSAILDHMKRGSKLYISGSLTEGFIKRLVERKLSEGTTLVVKDHTKIFLSPESMDLFLESGGRLMVLRSPNLLAVTFNPISPQGYVLNSGAVLTALKKALDVPVIDVMEGEKIGQRKTL